MGIDKVWRPIPSVGGRYEVTCFGGVRNTKTGLELRPGLASNGYLTVALGRKNTRTVHSLVAEVFLGPRPDGMDVMHLNGCRTDNYVENLRYGTRSENNKDAFWHGHRRMTPALLQQIKAALAVGVSGADIARTTGFSESQISNVKHGHQYPVD